MQQTTCGVTPKKTKVFNRNVVVDFLKENEQLFKDLNDSQYCLYDSNKLVSDHALNYLNSYSGNNNNEQLKIILKNEFVKCESIYPFLGDFFINSYFLKEKYEDSEKYVLSKDSACDFSNSLKFKEVSNIFELITNHASMEYAITVQKSILKDIHVEKNSLLNFDLDYDASFLGNKDFHKMNEYKFIIIDGFIESIGEIHHLLDQANRTKIPHVIFCFGMSEEVSHVIKYNNSQSKLEVFPVIINFDENTINVLNDIAVLHKDHIVSSRTGETISQAVRRELPIGNEITFHRNGFKIKPIASELDMIIHRDFLNKKINKVTTHVESKKILSRRLKRFSSKSIKIHIPEKIYENNDFMRELDYMLRFVKNANRRFFKVDFNKRKYFIPVGLPKHVQKVTESIEKMYSQIETMVTYERD